MKVFLFQYEERKIGKLNSESSDHKVSSYVFILTNLIVALTGEGIIYPCVGLW